MYRLAPGFIARNVYGGKTCPLRGDILSSISSVVDRMGPYADESCEIDVSVPEAARQDTEYQVFPDDSNDARVVL